MHKRCRAFTLTELAIVLGVVGMLLAVIWAAASDVRMTSQVRLANTELVAISHNVRTVFMEQGGVRGMNTSLTPALDRLRAFPLDMRQNPTLDAGIVFHPWSQTIDKTTSLGNVLVAATDCTGVAATDNTTAEPCFSVSMLNLPQKACAQVLTATTLTGTGLQAVLINGTNTALPVNTNTAGTNCSLTTPTNTVQWVYLLRDKT